MTPIILPAKAAAQLLALAQARNEAQMRLDDASSMARAMAEAPPDWELRAEDGLVVFAPPATQVDPDGAHQ
jgi:hypothetical protein